jgi:3-oxoacyl-[acyl-carrier protein] reductase
MDFKNAKVLVTGGSLGIGKETAHQLIEKGAKVCIAARNIERCAKVADEIGAIPIQADVSDEKDVIRMVQEANKKMGGYNVLINNAAYGGFAKLVETDTEEFQEMIQTNLVGAMMVGRESAKIFVENDYGNIINISSSAGKKGFAGGSMYCATKFGLGGLTECWRAELRPHNIRVMQMNPSEVQTHFSKNAGMGNREFNKTKLVASDIAETIVAMLALPDRGFITESSVWATNPQ